MCDPVAGAAPHLHADVTEAVESSSQGAFAATETTKAAKSEESETAAPQTSSAGAQNTNWLEDAEKIKAPALGADQKDWIAYAEQLAKTAGISEGMVTDMIRTKKVPSPIESHAANDGSNEAVHGLLSVHGGLLEGGSFGDTSHALKDSTGKALTAADMKDPQDPGKATLAGVQHLKQLIDHYNGNEIQALNHYQTGDPANSNHPLKDWCGDDYCTTETGSHDGKHHQGSPTEDSDFHLKSADVAEQFMSKGIKASLESIGAKDAGHHPAFTTSSGSGNHHAEATSHTDGSQKGAEHQASSFAGTQAAHQASGHSGHGEDTGHHDGGAASASSTKPAEASSQSSHNEGGGHHGGEHGGSSSAHTAHQPMAKAQEATDTKTHGAHGEFKPSGTQSQEGVTGITGLGTDKSLQEYITPDSHSPSQHIGESHGLGFLMHRPTHDAAMETVFGKPASEVISSIQSTLEQTGTYLTNKPGTEKIKGAYLTGNMLMKQAMLPANLFGSEQNAGSAYAQAKLSAIDGDVASLRNLIEQKGGDTLGLSDEQLRNVWATNEHNNLHGILDAGSPIGQSIHMTSLNDNAGDGTPKGTMGGYNDKGEYPQWGWFEDIQDIGSKFSDLNLDHQIDYSHK